MKGFTLIELLVVVLIIGILASIALPQYELVVEKSRASEAMVNAKALQDAMQRHEQEFPGESVTNCTQIADVQLKGGTWDNGTVNCTAASDQTFTTRNFTYNISGNSIVVTRKNGDTTLYVINYPKSVDSIPTLGTGCAQTATYYQVCKLFTNI